jgi:cytochrome c oxidase subunit 2
VGSRRSRCPSSRLGAYDLGCAEHCGLGHYRMRGKVHVVAAADFDRALAEAAAP